MDIETFLPGDVVEIINATSKSGNKDLIGMRFKVKDVYGEAFLTLHHITPLTVSFSQVMLYNRPKTTSIDRINVIQAGTDDELFNAVRKLFERISPGS